MPSRRELANALRFLAIDSVEKAKSGHPGMPMGMADIAEVLWNDFLKFNPRNPNWLNRDRFILSNGHGCLLQYGLLHLSGYDLSLEELQNFRQLHSKTPGHPEYGITPGIETTTGPLGQGIAHGVGMAIAERHLASQFNRDNFSIIDHYTYIFCGDGCLMEGISHEACSLAGTLKLGKLILIWDNNGISIDGQVSAWFSDNTAERFKAYGWQVIDAVDGHNPEEIAQAITAAQQVTDKPTLICCKTTIGFGAPNVAGSERSHGAPLGAEEINATRNNLHWPYPPFVIPTEVYTAWDAKEKGQKLETKWQNLFDQYQQAYPKLAAELKRRMEQQLPEQWQMQIANYIKDCILHTQPMATRKSSQNCLNFLAPLLPEVLGGSADLTESNGTRWSEAKHLSADSPEGNYLCYGVREFAMSAIICALGVYKGIIPFGGTFLTFSDYARNALRLCALMRQRAIYVYTHDSIGLGEDGPTHQPIEHLNSLRMIPNLTTWRPCDDVETAVAWQAAIENLSGPSCLMLTRQPLPQQQHSVEQIENIKRGGYILHKNSANPKLLVLATGSEVKLAIAAAKELSHYPIQVVSLPSTEVFNQQSEDYRQQVLPPQITKRIAIEAGSPDYWYRYVGREGTIIAIDRFGESAPANEIFALLGFTVENIMKVIKDSL